MTITAKQASKKFGDPITERHMVLWDVPANLRIRGIPARLYCNKLLIAPLTKAFGLIISRGLGGHIKTWDGCFNIRKQRGSWFAVSLHAWGIAFDINASWNRLGQAPTMSKELVACFTEAGFEWGGNWKRPDGMHFQLATI
jgi:D-alanyl-D-alanine carboxypeptidase